VSRKVEVQRQKQSMFETLAFGVLGAILNEENMMFAIWFFSAINQMHSSSNALSVTF